MTKKGRSENPLQGRLTPGYISRLNLSFQRFCELLVWGRFVVLIDGGKRVADDDDKRVKPERRAGDRRVADNPDFKGPDRRKGDRRAGKDRRSSD